MKKIIFLTAVLICANTFAINAPFATGSAVSQVYQSDHSQPVTTIPTASNSGPSLLNSAGVETGAEGAVSQLTQSTLSFEQDADQRIQNLTYSNHAMSTALQTIEQNITQLQQQIAMLSSTDASSKQISHHRARNSGFDFALYLNLIAAGLFLLLSGLMIGKLMTRRAPIQITKNIHSSSDYDFMETAEAIPAQLDLARSYIAMHDFDQARVALKIVMEKGNAQQRKSAETLVEKLK